MSDDSGSSPSDPVGSNSVENDRAQSFSDSIVGDERERLAQIFETLLQFARQDFESRAPVSGSGDTIDAIAQGLNMLAEELRGEVASRQELEAAYAQLGEAQARAAHSGKLAAVGQLASGIAHEINNPATAVTMTLALSRRRLEQVRERISSGELQREIDGILGHLGDAGTALERIRAVTGDLRTFARADADLRELHSLNETVAVACRLAAPTLRARAEIHLELGDIPAIVGSRARMAQVVTNLVVNAAQAIEGLPKDPARHHTITVSTRRAPDGVVLCVEDTGPGIPEHLRERVLEPFFTTKPADIGTGLGLALVSEIVTGEGGRVELGARDGGGARVSVYLPEPELRFRARRDSTVDGVPKGMRVLLIDDERLLLSALGEWLREAYGCDVTIANGGQQGIDICNAGSNFDLILCDIHMPRVTGVDVFRWLSAEVPEAVDRFAFLSGGALTDSARSFLGESSVPLLAKPFRERELHELLLSAASARVA